MMGAAVEPQYLPYESVANFVVVLFLVFGAIITIDKVLDVIKKHRKPKLTAEQELVQRQAACDRHFQRDLERIERLEKGQKQQQETDRIVLTALRAILSHEINGNSIDRMKEANEAIDQMLINR